jgi:hypothetical protein
MGFSYSPLHVTQAGGRHAQAYLLCNLESESSIEEISMQGVIHKMYKTCDQLASFRPSLRPYYYHFRPFLACIILICILGERGI